MSAPVAAFAFSIAAVAVDPTYCNTLSTEVAWTHYSFGVTSDNLVHDKFAAAVFIASVLDSLNSELGAPLQEVDIFSYGAAQHLKQKYMFMYASSLFYAKDIRINWHYCVT